MSPSRPLPFPGPRTIRSPRSGREAVCAAKEFAVVQDSEPEAALDADDQKIVEAARLPEPVLSERHKIGVAVDRHRDAKTLASGPRQGDVAVAEDRALPAYAGGALDDPRQPDADARMSGIVRSAS